MDCTFCNTHLITKAQQMGASFIRNFLVRMFQLPLANVILPLGGVADKIGSL